MLVRQHLVDILILDTVGDQRESTVGDLVLPQAAIAGKLLGIEDVAELGRAMFHLVAVLSEHRGADDRANGAIIGGAGLPIGAIADLGPVGFS